MLQIYWKQNQFENGVFWMPQIPFAIQFECERPNDLCTAELPFGCLEMFVPFLLKTAEWQFGQTFQNKKYLYFWVWMAEW